jgi:undecaprenyl diphosphate synthase
MHLRIVNDYSSHDSIVRAAGRADRNAKLTPQDFHRLLQKVDHSALSAGAADLLIRTGGERPLSDFMLWEVTYAELHFTDCLWSDFDEYRFDPRSTITPTARGASELLPWKRARRR